MSGHIKLETLSFEMSQFIMELIFVCNETNNAETLNNNKWKTAHLRNHLT